MVGADFGSIIERELNEALCVMVLWSRVSIDSTWVRNEARAALKRDILRPLLIDAVTDPLEFRHLHIKSYRLGGVTYPRGLL